VCVLRLAELNVFIRVLRHMLDVFHARCPNDKYICLIFLEQLTKIFMHANSAVLNASCSTLNVTVVVL